MSLQEQKALFEALLAVAAADGRLTRAERGLLGSFAERIKVGPASLNATIERALREASLKQELSTRTVGDPLKAMELLVATARLDGEISEEKRQLLARIAMTWDISPETFGEAFQRGLTTADRLRESHKEE